MFTVSKNTAIIVDSNYDNTKIYNQVLRAANDLREDIALVTGVIDYKYISSLFTDSPALQKERLDKTPHTPSLKYSGNGIIIGTINQSSIIDKLIADGKLDDANSVSNHWESYVIKEVDSSLVIAGSDARGTIYGIYHISEELGVSPWYWFSDVSVKVFDKKQLNYEAAFISKEPSVKYRGIFINDEERLIDWAREKFHSTSTPDVNLYRRVFELILRLKANTLWPAMHQGSDAFNLIKDHKGIPINAKEASLYGVVMASSHCEMMLRCNVSEWEDFKAAHYDEYVWQDNGSFDYTQNKEAILGYWKERLETNKDFESILALGVRGIHDGDAETDNLYLYNNSKVELMRDVINEQRKLIKEVYGSETAVPQVFIPYKGMATIYNDGLKNYIPDDVMLMWAEDNYGNLRQIPTKSEAERKGGCGVYYHSSYWSWFSPKSYLWLNSTQVFYMVHQLRRAYECNSRAYWILNVGDIKPGDIVTELFLKIAYDTEYGKDVNKCLINHAMRDFHVSFSVAQTIVKVLTEFYHLCGIKKAEFFGHENPANVNNPFFSQDMIFPFNFDECTWLIEKTNCMVDTLTHIFKTLPKEDRDAFYEQVFYHILSYRDVSEEYCYLWKNNFYAQMGNIAKAKDCMLLSKKARSRIITEQENYWKCNNNKWTKVINYDHPVSYFNMNEGVLLVHDDKYLLSSDSAISLPDLSFDDMIVINAEDFSESIKGTDNSEWIIEKDAGRLTDACTAVPFSADKSSNFENTAKLRYRVYFSSSGVFTGKFYRIPSLNEGINDDGTPRTCNTAIGVNDSAPVVLCGNSDVNGRWKENIMHMIEDIDFEITIPSPGWHDIFVYKIDAGIIFDKIVINTSEKSFPPSLLGFPVK